MTVLNVFPFAVAPIAVSIVEKNVLAILILDPMKIRIKELIAKMRTRELMINDWICNVRGKAIVFNKNLMSLAVVAQIMKGLTISG